jgi:L-asparaginase / beta-aspartyl-peptidase
MTKPVIIVHGGAGRIAAGRIEAAREGCRLAALLGWRRLAAGGTAIDAVQLAVTALEDNPEFNAGTGSVLNAQGEVQLDASIMDGANLAAGAVGGVRGIRNPILLAREVLEHGRHVLLVGSDAVAFARTCGVPICDNSKLAVQRQRERWEQEHGTVGAVALDQHGRLAAATSTGGRFGSLPGRVGDSALIGCGTYASGEAAVSCTGIGEAIIRTVLAHTAAELVGAGHNPIAAAGGAIEAFGEQTASEAGLIVLDAHGGIGYAHNAEHMAVAVVNADGEAWTAI